MGSGGFLHCDAPTVSIVIPTYNRERYLAASLDSVRAQSFEDWEVVVYDDGSTDGTLEIAAQYASIDERIRVCAGSHGGVAVTRNRGLEQTNQRSEFVIFLDSDDRWERDALSALLGVLHREPEFVSVYGQLRCMDEAGQPIVGDDMADVMRARQRLEGNRVVPVPVGAPLTFSALAVHNWVTTPGLHLIRRAVVEEVGGFDPSTDPADDWDFNIRVSRRGPIAFRDDLVLHWRRHGSALTNTSPRWKRAYYAVRKKMLTDPSNTEEQRRVARAGYTWMVRDAVGQAGQALRDRRMRQAARHLARAAQSMVERVRAEFSRRFRPVSLGSSMPSAGSAAASR